MQLSVKAFLEGRSELTRIIGIEYNGWGNSKPEILIYRRNDRNEICIEKKDYYPYVWITEKGYESLFHGDKYQRDKILNDNKIIVKYLKISNNDTPADERMINGYRILLKAVKPMSFKVFQELFEISLESDEFYGEDETFFVLSPIQQYMTEHGIRFFKGFEDYDDVLRLTWDIETEGLDCKIHRITQIGIRTNRGFEKIIHVDLFNTNGEIEAIENFLNILKDLRPDLISGHNSENFDWQFIMGRCAILQGDNSFEELSKKILGTSIKKKTKETCLKLGGETEWFKQTVYKGHTIVDSLHAVRRAQAIDSSMKSANLKYAAKYKKVAKKNRVYIPGDKISTIFKDKNFHYIFNNITGVWRQMENGEVCGEDEEYVNGEYIADRYLKDDLWEGDRVEYLYNLSNFYVGKLIAIPYQKVLTMGTAALWNVLLIEWSFINDLAIPLKSNAETFVGGISRLLKVGYAKDVVKLDYNSLYPSITLTYKVYPTLDITHIFEMLLDYILTEREYHKDLKNQYKLQLKKTNDEKEIDFLNGKIIRHDTLQLPYKIFANAFFGSYGAPNIFNWGDVRRSEEITCIGRQSLRLLVKWFEERGFRAIVGDTDGINFCYTDVDLSYKYIGKGNGRNVKNGEEYTGIEAYVKEFEDLFLRGKMGLGIDEIIPSSCYFSRKNYADLLDNGEIKLVGNSIKSKKMPKYIEKFLDENLPFLLRNDGQTFILNYYRHISKINNLQIPIKDLCSIGKIKVSKKQYLERKNKTNKNGNTLPMQVHYELLLKNNKEFVMGENVYYINIGDGVMNDISRKEIYKREIIYSDQTDMFGDKIPLFNKNKSVVYSKVLERVEYTLNCVQIDNSIIDSEIDYYGYEDVFPSIIKPNIKLYIDRFNNRIKGLLVCFLPEIRDKILITCPNDKIIFTKDECKLCSGKPFTDSDQDTIEELLTMDEREINFWRRENKIPPFANMLL